jgi:putative redox protein
MVEIWIDYEGQLRCDSKHMPSGTKLATDAPVDNQGRGESFSPTDLVATALGSCMATIMGITASHKNIDLGGMRIIVQKHMSPGLPRRIDRLDLEIFMPVVENHPDKKVLQSAALSCPVQHSIHPNIKVDIQWHWMGGSNPA